MEAAAALVFAAAFVFGYLTGTLGLVLGGGVMLGAGGSVVTLLLAVRRGTVQWRAPWRGRSRRHLAQTSCKPHQEHPMSDTRTSAPPPANDTRAIAPDGLAVASVILAIAGFLPIPGGSHHAADSPSSMLSSSPGVQSSASQMAVSVLNRMARA
jgi:hypothetical protein